MATDLCSEPCAFKGDKKTKFKNLVRTLKLKEFIFE